MEGRNSIPKPQSEDKLGIATLNASQMASHLSPEDKSNKRPPSHPNNPGHSRSLSQSTFFSPCGDPSVLSLSDVSMGERVVNSNVAGGSNEFLTVTGESKGHRRSSSDVPLVFSTSSDVPHSHNRGMLDRSDGSFGVVKGESEWKNDCGSDVQVKSKGDIADDLFNAYMNLETLETLNSFGIEDKDLDSKSRDTKTHACQTSENEADSRLNKHPIGIQNENTQGVNKRMASGDIAPIVRHYRSVSMDSYMGSLQFDEHTPKIPPLANHGNYHHSADANSSKFNFEMGSSEFNESELKKIMENDKLAEMASVDPKRVKRILANRQSAARSKQRKMQYIVELEQKVQTLQTEITTLSAQITMLQRDYDGLSSQNNELKFRIQAMKQHAQLKDALNEALAAEAQRLKLTAAEFSGETYLSNCMIQQHSINHPTLRLQPRQLNVYQMQRQQNSHNDQSQTQQQNDDDDANESK